MTKYGENQPTFPTIPKKINKQKKDKSMLLVFTKDDKEKLIKLAEDYGISVSELVRFWIINTPLKQEGVKEYEQE